MGKEERRKICLKEKNNKRQKIKEKYGRKKWKEKNEKEYIKENLKNKEHVCYPALDFSKKSIMNLCIYGKRKRMKWVIK